MWWSCNCEKNAGVFFVSGWSSEVVNRWGVAPRVRGARGGCRLLAGSRPLVLFDGPLPFRSVLPLHLISPPLPFSVPFVLTVGPRVLSVSAIAKAAHPLALSGFPLQVAGRSLIVAGRRATRDASPSALRCFRLAGCAAGPARYGSRLTPHAAPRLRVLPQRRPPPRLVVVVVVVVGVVPARLARKPYGAAGGPSGMSDRVVVVVVVRGRRPSGAGRGRGRRSGVNGLPLLPFPPHPFAQQERSFKFPGGG